MRARESYDWEDAAARWKRLGDANHHATVEWLRSLDERASIEVFEDLSRGIPEVDPDPSLDLQPVVLFRIWRDR